MTANSGRVKVALSVMLEPSPTQKQFGRGLGHSTTKREQRSFPVIEADLAAAQAKRERKLRKNRAA
jgi:hypothetical protein